MFGRRGLGDGFMALLDVRNVSKSFGAIRAVNDISFSVAAGEVVGLMGDNGAGKSTMVKLVAGNFPPGEGEIAVAGEVCHFHKPIEARAKGIEVVYQDLALADNLSIGANIFLGREPMKKLYGILPVIDRKKMADVARETMQRLDFHVERLDAPVAAFSGGQRQAVAIGRAMYWNARLVIMDEPTAALGVPEQRKVISLIQSLKAEGKGIIFISHNLRDIFEVADRIVVFRRGENAGERLPKETSGDEIVRMMVGK